MNGGFPAGWAEREGSPLAGDISKAAKGCAKLAHRFAKTISFSDSFYAQLRELRVVFEEQAIAVTMTFGVGGFRRA